MMDDLGSPVEAGLVFYDRVQRALLGGIGRALATVTGVALILASLWLTVLIAGPADLRIDASDAWTRLHVAAVVAGAPLGVALLRRQPWAVLLLYPAVLGLQVAPLVLARGSLTGGDVSARMLSAAVLVECAVLVLFAAAVALPAPSGSQEGELAEQTDEH